MTGHRTGYRMRLTHPSLGVILGVCVCTTLVFSTVAALAGPIRSFAGRKPTGEQREPAQGRPQKWRHYVGLEGRNGRRPKRRREIQKEKREKQSGVREIWPKPGESRRAFKKRVNEAISHHVRAKHESRRKKREAAVHALDQDLGGEKERTKKGKETKLSGKQQTRPGPGRSSWGETSYPIPNARTLTMPDGTEMLDFREGEELKYGPPVYNHRGKQISGAPQEGIVGKNLVEVFKEEDTKLKARRGKGKLATGEMEKGPNETGFPDSMQHPDQDAGSDSTTSLTIVDE
mmetsp:Transcript_9607/g.23641  ORF Transcript_9607/g.23641 Transcript_9607/m.23641 type:complete len:289 (+) Transcript_9607:107-973(+)|eukprot:CAMPEP_0114514876 /NCGR_PEP_ID=MMETSP0109-20121206/16403_1 /TAXON_ID=29199 /ORGANISM="Chlorarachnion reptans, Strain CCCM449" /LENGTH=288 /DNA_ID=CAMNT_0001694977 /DNA_START=61 /DNA_END=927 /DNA_ORIENTATION=+